LAGGILSPKIDRVFVGLGEYAAAHRYMEKKAQIGKVDFESGSLLDSQRLTTLGGSRLSLLIYSGSAVVVHRAHPQAQKVMMDDQRTFLIAQRSKTYNGSGILSSRKTRPSANKTTNA
jgi:hypothetical protein